MPVKVTIRAELQDAEAGPEVQKIGLSFKSLPPEPVVVQTVAPATWGSDRGIQGGQQIVAINGLDVATMTQQEFRAALKARPLTLRFRISDDPEEEPLQAAVASSDVDKLGMSFQSLPPEPVIVNKVAAGGWAESVGFLGGEEILVVNGESTVAMSSEDFKAALRVRPLVLRFQQPAEEEDEQDDLVQEVEVGPEVSKIGLSFHNLPPEPVVVNKVAAGTWAESVGFIGGEEILALNDEDVASMTSERFKSVLKSRPLLIRFQASEFEEVEAGEEVLKIGLSFKALPPEPLVVSKVAPGSWAATVGFQGGEEIAAINGVAVADMSNEDFKALLRARPLTLRIVSSTVAAADPPAGQTDKDARDKQQAQAATKIQAIHRGNLARKEGQAKRKKKVAKEAKEGEAATKIQAIHRGNLARKEAHSQKEEEEDGRSKQPEKAAKEAQGKQEEEAATKIQAIHRGNLARKDGRGKQQEKAAKEAQSKQEEEAATKIQAIHRRNLARKDGRSKPPEKAAKEAQSKQEEEAATKIQAIHRGNLARKDGRSKQPEKAAKETPSKQEEEAATKIQAIHRGNLARKDGRSKQPEKAAKEAQSKQEEEAATKIQAIHRGNLAQKDGRRKQPEKAAKAAQSKTEEEAATKIQAIHRGNLARKEGRSSEKQTAAEQERPGRSSKGSRSLRASIVEMAGPKHSAERASRTRRRAEAAKSSRSGSAGRSPRRSRSSQGSESDRSPSAGRDPAAKLYSMPSSLATPATPVSWLVEEFGGATSSRATTPSPRPVSPKRSASAPNSARVRPNSGAALRQFRAELLRREGTFAAGWRRILDSSATGFVTHAEFCEACRRMNYRGNIRDAWHELDADGSGKATICELDWPTAEALGKFTTALASRFGGVDQAAKSWGLRGGRRLRKEEFRSLVSGILEAREADSIFRMICCHDTLARPSVRAEDLRWLQQLSPSLPRVAANRVEPGMLAAEQLNELAFQTPGEVPSEAVGEPSGPVAPLEPGETSPRTPRTPRSASQPVTKRQEPGDEGFMRLTREDLYNRLYREAKDFHKRKQEKHEKEGLFKKPEPNLSAAQTGSTAYFKRLYNKGLLQKAQQEERRQRLEREADEHFRKPRQPRRDVPSWLHKANPELSAKLQEPVWTRLQKPREPKKEEPTPVATPRHLTVESVSTAACRADVAAAAADRLYSQAQKRKERERKKKDAEDGLQAIKEKKEKEVKLTKERQNDLVLRLHNYGQEKQKEAMEKREEARKAAEEEVRQLADRRRGKSNKVRPETFFRLHLDGLQREEALAERRKMKEMEEEHRLKAESIHCGAAPNPDVFHMLHASYNAKQGRVVNKTVEAEEAEAEAASDEGSEHFDTEVEQANLDLSAWKLSQGPRSPDDGGGEDGPDPRSREPSDRRKSNEEDRASTLQELREVRRSRLAMHDWMETQKRELKAGDDRFRTPPGASIAPAERPADSPSLEGGPEGNERALQALLQRRPGSVPGGKRRSVAATLLSKELFGSDDEKDEPLPSQSSHDADPLWGAVSDIVSWKRKDEAT